MTLADVLVDDETLAFFIDSREFFNSHMSLARSSFLILAGDSGVRVNENKVGVLANFVNGSLKPIAAIANWDGDVVI